MRVSLGLPTHRVDLGDELASAAAIREASVAAEQAGFDAVFVTDHPFPPAGWLAKGGHHTLDPLVSLAFAAAATTTLRLQTNLFVPAYRNPFVAAKAISTLDALSGGRVILGVGAGYLEDEFAATGADFDRRNDLLDEALIAMKAAWTGEVVTFEGSGFAAASNVMLPTPTQTPHPPIWIGGNSKRAIRRAVELADGWIPMPSPGKASGLLRTPGMETLADLKDRLGYAAEHAATVGRTAPLEVAFMPSGLSMFATEPIDAEAVVEGIAAMAEVGVTYATVTSAPESRAELMAFIDVFAGQVLPQVESI